MFEGLRKDSWGQDLSIFYLLFRLQIIPKFFLVGAIVFLSLIDTSYAGRRIETGVGKVRECVVATSKSQSDTGESSDNSPGNAIIPEHSFSGPYTLGNPEQEVDLANPYCIAIFAGPYVNFKATLLSSNIACGRTVNRWSHLPNPLSDSWNMLANGIKAASNGACATANAATGASLLGFLGAAGVTYEVAKKVYNTTRVCGSNWVAPNDQSYMIDRADLKAQRKQDVTSLLQESGTDSDFMSDLKYREWFFDGVEVEDNVAGDDYCRDVFGEIGSDKSRPGDYPPQRYYLKGLQAGNFNCERYNPNNPNNEIKEYTDDLDESAYQKAYQCCLSRAKEYICIEKGSPEDPERIFCKAGEQCYLRYGGTSVTFEANYKDNGRMICAKTYSLCPFNFNVGGGTEFCDYFKDGVYKDGKWDMMKEDDYPDQDASETEIYCGNKSSIRGADCKLNIKAGKCRNYCQYYTHCTMSSGHYTHKSEIVLPYFSRACINFIGDSQNVQTYNGGIIGSPRHFTAPIAQCVKETLENVFYNRAGHSKCKSDGEIPVSGPEGEECESGNYYILENNLPFKEGGKVQENSFFSNIRELMKDSVTAILTLSVIFFGGSILAGRKDIRDKKELITYILKIAFIFYFVVGDGMEDIKVMDGIYGVSNDLSQILFKLTAEDDERKRDGCQFGKIVNEEGVEIEEAGTTYAPNVSYLAVWDSLDCKIARYLSFGPSASVANIALLIFAFFFTGPVGIYFSLSIMAVGIILIVLAIKALHIFLASCLAIIIMIFISPITITALLFDKTKDMFNKWLTNLISFALQPALLFAYIYIVITMMDKVLLGSAYFIGDAPHKDIRCAKVCQLKGQLFYEEDGVSYDTCLENEGGLESDIIYPINDSVACLLDFSDFGRAPGFEVIGLSFSIVDNLLSGDVKEKSITLLKGALLMYLLLKFIDEIPAIAASLTGGAKLPGANINAANVMKRGASFAAGAQKRIARGARAGVNAMGGAGKSAADKATRSDGNKSAVASGGDNAANEDRGKSGNESSGGDNDGNNNQLGNGSSDKDK